MSLLKNLTRKEKEAIEELRKRMINVLNPEMMEDLELFYRFLKARDFDIDKGELMLRKHIIWRKAHGTDTILEDFEPSYVFLNYIQGTYLGEDKEGHPIRYMPFGSIDIRDIINCFKQNDYIKHLIWMLEKDISRAKESNRGDIRFTQIIDLDKLSLSNVLHPAAAAMSLRTAHFYQDNYPERLHLYYVINAPRYYVIIYSVIKKVLALEVIRKIHVFGKTGWKKELLKAIDADVLPGFLGGNKTDPDGNPMCNTFVYHGGRVPSKYYLYEEDRSFKDVSKVKQITIFPRKSFQIPVNVQKFGAIIEWEYKVKEKDIGFGLFFKKSENELKEIIPVYRFDTPDGTQTGSHKCQCIGTYVIMFDNTFSWIKSKEVLYIIKVLKPQDYSAQNENHFHKP